MVSHTTTGEWQSFEQRMRQRRAQRLAVRAEAAVEAGCLDEARACVEEARALAPALPQLAAIEDRLSAPRRGQGAGLKRAAALAAAAAVAAAAAAAGWVMMPRSVPDPITAPIVSEPRQVPAVVKAPPPVESAATPQPITPSDDPSEAVPAAASRPQPDAGGSDIPPLRPQLPAAEETKTAPLPAVTPSEEPVVTDAPVAPPSAPPAAAAPVPMPMPMPAATLAIDLPAGPPPAPPAVERAPVDPPQEPVVRTVLNRYASAYSALDVDAALRVWPGVNRAALSRAFDSLASQRISLDECRINVAAASATARCAGTATWAPKVGASGPRTEARDWTFELARAAGGWQIVSARVQNR